MKGFLDTYNLGAVQLVAVSHWLGNPFDSELFDWAAYIGPTDWGFERISQEGCKLLDIQAKAFFTQPTLPIEKYRS